MNDPHQKDTPQDLQVPIEGADQEDMPLEEPRRAASLTLRAEDVRDRRAASMAAANQSLADALRITYRLIQLAMVVLAGLFLYTAFVQVGTGERGVKVVLGQIWDENVLPGATLSAPPPLGEVIKVSTGVETIELQNSFSQGEAARPAALRPGLDGSLITGDGNIIHLELVVRFRRGDPQAVEGSTKIADYVRNIRPVDEQNIIVSAVESATVKVIAETPIDNLIRRAFIRQGGPVTTAGSIESRIRQRAQQRLDQMNSGLSIDSIAIQNISPPASVREDFEAVTNAEQRAAEALSEASSERSEALNKVAGAAAEPLLALIDEYGKALDASDAPDAGEDILERIGSLLRDEYADAQDIEIAGKRYSNIKVAGRVAEIMNRARNYQTTVVDNARTKAETYRSKLDSFRANPRVFLSREYAEAMMGFMQNANAKAFWIPEDTQFVEIRVNNDPEQARQAEEERRRRQAEENTRIQRGLR